MNPEPGRRHAEPEPKNSTFSFSESLRALRRNALPISAATGIVALVSGIGVGWWGASIGYVDFPVGGQSTSEGRTKNALAALVSGVTAQKAFGSASFEFEVHKTLWSDCSVKGVVNPKSIKSHIDLLTTSSTFTGNLGADQKWEGEIAKSEYNWNVQQKDGNTYEIGRFMGKFDHTLKLSVDKGVIQGELSKGLSFNWKISGTYDSSGRVSIQVDCPFSGDLQIVGKAQLP